MRTLFTLLLPKIFSIGFISMSLFSTSCLALPEYKPTSIDSRSSIQKIGKLNVLNLYGNREEVAYQHGLFARELVQKKQSALNHYIPLIKNSILNATDSSFLGKIYAKYVDTILTNQYVNRTIPTRDQYVYAALASGAGLSDVKDVYRAALFADIGQYLLGKDAENEYFDFVKHLPSYGCTTLIAKSDSSQNSELIGRNFDFSSFGSYEKNAAVIYVHPTEPEDQQYAMFTSLGLHSSHTTWNESGLFLSIHQLMVTDNKVDGTYILGITDEVTRRAHSLSEAQRIIESHGITSSWRLIIHSSKEHRTLLADLGASRKSFKYIDDNIHFFTNHVFDSEFAKNQHFPYYNYGWDTLQRFNYLKAKTEDLTNLSTQQIVDLMSSRNFILSDNSVIQKHIGAVAKQSNLMSVIIDTAKNTVYFAVPENEFELSPTGSYQALPLDFSMNWLNNAKISTPVGIKAVHKLSRNFIETESLMRRAESLYESHVSIENIFPLVKKAYSLSQDDINISLVKAGMELKLYGNNNSKTDLLVSARATLESITSNSKNEDHEKHPTEIAKILLARAYVLSGEYGRAYGLLRNWTGTTSSYITVNAEKDLKLLETNENNIVELRKSFNESLKRLSFEISDTDISTL